MSEFISVILLILVTILAIRGEVYARLYGRLKFICLCDGINKQFKITDSGFQIKLGQEDSPYRYVTEAYKFLQTPYGASARFKKGELIDAGKLTYKVGRWRTK